MDSNEFINSIFEALGVWNLRGSQGSFEYVSNEVVDLIKEGTDCEYFEAAVEELTEERDNLQTEVEELKKQLFKLQKIETDLFNSEGVLLEIKDSIQNSVHKQAIDFLLSNIYED